MIYHGFWLFYDLHHLHSPWALFFVAMAVFGILRSLAYTVRRHKKYR